MASVLEPMLTASVGDEAITASALVDLDFGLSLNEGILVLGVGGTIEMRDITESTAWMTALSTDPSAAALAWDTAGVFELRSDIIWALAIQQEFGTAVGVGHTSVNRFVPLGNMVDQGYLVARNLRLILDETNGTAGALTYAIQVYYKRVRLTDSEIAGAIVTRGR